MSVSGVRGRRRFARGGDNGEGALAGGGRGVGVEGVMTFGGGMGKGDEWWLVDLLVVRGEG